MKQIRAWLPIVLLVLCLLLLAACKQPAGPIPATADGSNGPTLTPPSEETERELPPPAPVDPSGEEGSGDPNEEPAAEIPSQQGSGTEEENPPVEPTSEENGEPDPTEKPDVPQTPTEPQLPDGQQNPGEQQNPADRQDPSGQTEENAAGNWTCEMTLDAIISADVAEDDLNGMPMPTFPGVTVTLRMDLGADGSYHLYFDRTSLQLAQEDMHAPLRKYLLDYFSSEYGLDEAAVEAALAAQNTTLDEKVEELTATVGLDALGDLDVKNRYSFRQGRLYVGEDPSRTADYYEIDLQGDRLVIVGVSDEEKMVALVKLLPLTFTR